MRCFVLLAMIGAATAMGSAAWSYDEAIVRDGGRVVGMVLLDGEEQKKEIEPIVRT